MSRAGRAAAAAAVTLTAAVATVVLAAPVSAATCRVMQVDNAVPVGIELTPRHLDVAYGGCVQFTDNAFGPAVTIKVGKHYSVTLNYSESTSAKKSYVATDPGRQQVTADNGTASAQGTITAGPAPSPSASRSPRTSPSPSASPRPHPSTSATGPQVAPSPHRTHRAGPPVVIPPVQPPPPGPGVSATPGTPPVVAQPSASAAAAGSAAGPLEPPGDRSIGLPASLAALALIGVGTALVRVLLAEPVGPVDSARSVGGSA